MHSFEAEVCHADEKEAERPEEECGEEEGGDHGREGRLEDQGREEVRRKKVGPQERSTSDGNQERTLEEDPARSQEELPRPGEPAYCKGEGFFYWQKRAQDTRPCSEVGADVRSGHSGHTLDGRARGSRAGRDAA
ncbi:MAG: hypothetical protein U0174_08025 [Polyangiaceae bacterium]